MKFVLLTTGVIALLAGSASDSQPIFCTGAALIVVTLASIMWMQKSDEQNLQEIEKEIGLRPYSQGEKQAMEQAERENYNKNIRSAVLWTDNGTTYVDYDGNIRKADTDEIVGFAYNRRSNE